MKFEPKAIKDAGFLANERLVIEVSDVGDVGYLAVFASSALPDGSVNTDTKYVHWFADTPVKAGDLIVLYTKGGTPGQKKKGEENNVYFFYWSLSKPIWGDGKLRPVLIEMETWTIFDSADDDTEPPEK